MARDKSMHVADEILVKFREDSGVARAMADAPEDRAASASAAIRSRYGDLGVRNVKQVFAGAPPAKEQIERALARLPRGKGKGAAAAERRLRRLARAEEAAQAHGLERVFLLELGEIDVREALARLRRDPGVEYAEPNRQVSIFAEALPSEPYIPDDRYVEDPSNPGYWSQGSWGQDYPDLWGLRMVEGIEGMNYFDANSDGIFDATETRPGEGVVVAVIDTGLDYGHEDLAANAWINPGEDLNQNGAIDPAEVNGIDDDDNGFIDDFHGWDFSNGDNDPMDDHGHGTHCSGTIAARGDNGLGLSGIAPFATIMGVKGLSEEGSGSYYGLAQCVYYAANNGADVLSNSWGGMGTSEVLEEAFNYAHSLDIVSLAAAGNDNANVIGFSPANIENVISVASIDHNKVKSDFSNWGARIDVSAPGGDSTDPEDSQRTYANILSCRAAGTDMYGDGVTIVDATYARARGTSMACPHAAGVAAALRCYYPNESQDEIRGRLVGGSVNIDDLNPGYQGLLGNGHVSVPGSIEVTPVPIVKILDVAAINVWPGEDATVWIRLKNYWADVYNVVGVFSTDSPWASISPGDATRAFGDLVTGATADHSADPITLSIDADAPYGATIEIEIALTGDEDFSETLAFRTTITIFTDVGPGSGLILNQEWLLTSTFGDYDNDGYADLLIENPTLFHNDQDGTFTLADAAGVTYGGDDWYSMFLDLNNDGHQDVFIGNTNNSQLFLNDGDGTFTDISQGSGLESTGAFAAAALDFDGDGLLDLVNGGYTVRLYRNNGDLTFTDVAVDAGLIEPEEYRDMLGGLFVTLDYDNDDDADLLTSTMSTVYLYRNNGDGTFTDVTVQAGLPVWPYAYGVLAGDYDNDGNIDVYLGCSWQPLLYRNNGDGTFSDVTEAAGNPGKDTGGMWTGCDFFDMDNDGDLDLHITNQTFAGVSVLRNTIWRNDDGVYVDATDMAIPAQVAPNLAAAAIGDFDNDGALDIYAPAGFGWGIGALLKNLGATTNNYLRIRLVDEVLNRDAYGARVTVTAGGISQVREVHTGAVQVQPLHFGIGDATMVDEIVVRWPGGTTKTLEDVAVNQLLTIASGAYPYLAAVEPAAAPIGNTVVLHGTNFGSTQGVSEVLFHDSIAASVTTWSATEIVCVVPQAATTGDVVVATGSGTTNGRHFEVVNPIRYATHRVADDWSEGSLACNGDGLANPGERVALAVTLENLSISALTDVTATLVFNPTQRPGEPYVTVDAQDNVFTFGTIGALSSAESNEYVLIDVDAACPYGYAATFTLVIHDGSQNVWQDQFTIVVAGETWPPQLGPIAAVDHAPSATSMRYSPTMASTDGGHVYLAWADRRTEGYTAIYFNSSIDYGQSWRTPDVLIDYQNSQSASPQVCADETGHVYVIWSRSGYAYFNRSTNYGAAGSWYANPFRVSAVGPKAYDPVVTCDESGYVYAAWHDAGKIYFSRSNNYGASNSWLSTPLVIMEATGLEHAEIAADQQGHVYVVARNGQDVLFNVSTNRGAGGSWLAEPVNLRSVDIPAWEYPYHARVAADEQGHVYISWRVENDVYAISSDNHGLPGSWLDEEVLLDSGPRNLYAFDPQIAADNQGHVFVSWREFFDVWIHASDDYGSAESLAGPSLEFDPSERYVWENQLEVADQGLVHLAWSGGYSAAESVYVLTSHDAGNSWPAAEVRLATGQSPVISADNDAHLYVAWVDRTDITHRIYAQTLDYNRPCTLDPVGDQIVAEGAELAITVTAHSRNGEPVEILHDLSLLSPAEQARMASAAWDTPQHNPGTGVTTRVFRWTPTDVTYIGDYGPVAIVARDSEGRVDFEYVAIRVDPDCNDNQVADSVELELGTSHDCNANGILDECDIRDATSDDCNENGIPDECDLASGTSHDCNENGILDDCDIADETSEDCNSNGIPDECETDCNCNGYDDAYEIAAGLTPDCNWNGIPDDCDIAEGTSQDCNANDVPDECESWSAVGGGLGAQWGAVYAMTWYDDKLYVAGVFQEPVGQPLNFVEVWDGTSWTPLNGGLNHCPRDFAVFDDGSGEALYAAGHMTIDNKYYIARLDGATWTPVVTGFNYEINALEVYDGALYAGGVFDTVDDATLNYVCKWDGQTVSAMDGGVDGWVNDLLVFNGKLYVAGFIQHAGTIETQSLAAWDGTAWSAPIVSYGLSGYFAAIAECSGQLYVGGCFPRVSNWTANNVARKVNNYLVPMGDGFDRSDQYVGTINALAAHDDGTGLALYAGGDCDLSGDRTVNYIAKWDGQKWLPLGSIGLGGSVAEIVGSTDGSHPLYVGGYFTTASPGIQAFHVAQWTGLRQGWDSDCDGVLDDEDNCPETPNPDQADCDQDGVGDACAGEPDCNANGVPDSCDIAGETSQDCNGNGVPDECEEDCNGNGVPDDCDVNPTRFGFDLVSSWYVGQGPADLVSRAVTAGGETVPLDMSGLGDYQAWLVVSNKDEDKITFVVVNSENSAFTGSVSVGDSPRGLVAADLNGDGYTDIAVANAASESVSIVLNQGSGQYWNGPAPAVDFPAGYYPNSVCAGDFDEDGDLDLAVANLYSGVSILANVGDATFESPVAISVGTYVNEVVTADLDADSHLDLVVDVLYNSKTVVLWGNGDGTFSTPEYLSPGVGPAVGDLDGDGVADVVLHYGGNARVFLSYGDGTFASPVDYPTGYMAWPFQLALDDLDGDGDVDLVVPVSNNWDQGCECYTGAEIGVLRNHGDGTFGEMSVVAEQLGPLVAVADLDGSGALDLAVVSDAQHAPAAPNRVTFLTNETVLPTSPDCNGNGIPDECEEGIVILGWRSVRAHDGLSDLSIALDAEAIGNGAGGPTAEPRLGGVRRIEVDFDRPAYAVLVGPVRIEGSNGSSPQPSAVSFVNGDETLRLDFAEGAFVDGICYTIDLLDAVVDAADLGGVLCDADCMVRCLAGDANGDGQVTLADADLVDEHGGLDPDAPGNAGYDVDTDGDIDGDDEAAVLGAVGNAATCWTGVTRAVPSTYETIQDAIDAASDGDRVQVAGGTYTGTGNKDLDPDGKAIWVRGEPGGGTVIDCEGDGRGFDVSSGEGPDTVIEGFTVLDGYVETSAGAGVYCSNSSPTIRDCTFTGGSSWAGSGILVVNQSYPTITNCALTNNLAWSSGGGLYVGMSSHAKVSGCRIAGNESEGGGGGVFAMWTDGVTLTNCTISGNVAAGTGGGVFVGEDTAAGVYNCLVDDCSASAGAQLAATASYPQYASSLEVAYSNVEGGTAEVYLSYGNLYWGEGNFDDDPLYAEPGYWDAGVWVDGDYRLQASSPCIDAGSNALVPVELVADLDGSPRIVDGDGDEVDVVDLGAYEAAAQ